MERRNHEGPEGSNAPTLQERQGTSRPSIADTATTPYLATEMQMMKEQMNFMMNALKGQVSSDLDELVHCTDLPSTVFVTSFPLFLKFRMP